MTTLRHQLSRAVTRLGERVDAEILLAHVLQQSRSWLRAHADDSLPPESIVAFEQALARREAGEPVAYIIGQCGFWTLDLDVTPATLIPRPETELLVELALQRMPVGVPVHIADLGTGSGAVALALTSERPFARVVATDLSGAALQVARRNAAKLQLAQVEFREGNWFAPLAGLHFDLIVSNPPYIEVGDPHLSEGDLRFEPLSALASGEDGLTAIRQIVDAARAHLVEGGWLLFEHGWNQGAASRDLLVASGYGDVFTALDLEQRDRVSGGRWKSA